MSVIEIPALRATDVVAVTLERTEIAAQPCWVVTVRECVMRPARRRWHPDEAAALAYAAEQADRHGLFLIDLREPEA